MNGDGMKFESANVMSMSLLFAGVVPITWNETAPRRSVELGKTVIPLPSAAECHSVG